MKHSQPCLVLLFEYWSSLVKDSFREVVSSNMWRIRTHFIRKSLLFSQWIYWIKPSTIFFPVARFLKNYTLYLCLFLLVVICCLILKIEPLHQKPDFDCVMLLDFFYIFSIRLNSLKLSGFLSCLGGKLLRFQKWRWPSLIEVNLPKNRVFICPRFLILLSVQNIYYRWNNGRMCFLLIFQSYGWYFFSYLKYT